MMFPHLNFQIQIHTIDDLLMSLVILDCDIALCVCVRLSCISTCVYISSVFFLGMMEFKELQYGCVGDSLWRVGMRRHLCRQVRVGRSSRRLMNGSDIQ